MREIVSEKQRNEQLGDIVRQMFVSTNVDVGSALGAASWVNMTIAEVEREKKNTRHAGRMPLRSRLRNLVMLILAQTSKTVK